MRAPAGRKVAEMLCRLDSNLPGVTLALPHLGQGSAGSVVASATAAHAFGREPSPAEMVAANSNASSSNFTKQLDALAAAATLDQTEGNPLSQRTRGKTHKTTLTASAAFVVIVVSVAYFVGTLR